MGNPEALKQLEAIVHPLVTAYKVRWLRQQAAARQTLVVLDVPLLFETGAETMCDAVAVVSCPAEVQRVRALARPGMTEAKLEGLLARQVWLLWGAACIVPCPGAWFWPTVGLPPPQPLNISTLSLFCVKQVPDAEKRQRADFVIDTVRFLHAVLRGALFVHGPRCVRPPVLQLAFKQVVHATIDSTPCAPECVVRRNAAARGIHGGRAARAGGEQVWSAYGGGPWRRLSCSLLVTCRDSTVWVQLSAGSTQKCTITPQTFQFNVALTANYSQCRLFHARGDRQGHLVWPLVCAA